MNTQKTDLATELRQAALRGDVKEIRYLVSKGHDPRGLHNAALKAAVRNGHATAASTLIELGVSVEYDELELLTTAAKNGDATMIGLLLRHMSHPLDNAVLDRALVAAAKSDNSVAVNALLDAGARANVFRNEALLAAAASGNVQIMRLLITYGADPDEKNGQALFNSSWQQHLPAVEYLLSAGADVTATNGAPLRIAIANGDPEMVDLLLNAGMPMGDPCWVIDVAYTDSLATLHVLEAHGKEWEPYADCLVAAAAEQGRARMLQYLLDEALILDRQELNRALELASKKGATACVILLLARGADARSNRSAACATAIQMGWTGIAHLLLEAGAEPDELPDNSFPIVLQHDRELALTLLKKSVPVNPASEISPDSAWGITNSIKPEEFFHNADGQLLPESIRHQRLLYCRHILDQAQQHSEADPVQLATWFAHVLASTGNLQN